MMWSKTLTAAVLTLAYTASAETYDYIIVGGGSTGLTVAGRLTEDPNVSVLVLEAGEAGFDNPSVKWLQYTAQAYGTSLDWQIYTVPQVKANNRVFRQTQGKVLGGMGALNGAIYVRPAKEEYAGLEQLGQTGWSWDTFDYFYKKSENFTAAVVPIGNIPPPDPSAHGHSGPIDVIIQSNVSKVYEDYVVPTLKNLGRRIHGEYNNGDPIGTTAMQMVGIPGTQWERSYGATGYLLPNLARKNLHFQTLSLVSRILWAPVAPRSNQPVTAVGVEYIQNGTFLNATSKNVIVSSGALLTPRVLEHSGVGDPEILEPLGIRTVIAAPRVGENVQHHPGIDVFWRTKNGSAIRGPEVFAPVWELQPQTKLLSAEDVNTSFALLASQPAGIPADQYAVLLDYLKQDLGQTEINWALRNNSDGTTDLQITLTEEHPYARGSIHINTTDPTKQPNYDPRTLTVEWDEWYLAKTVEWTRNVTATEPLASIIEEPVTLAGIDTFDGVQAYVRNNSRTIGHFCGTAAALPKENGGVVDPKTFKLYGSSNVFVADLSVLALVPAIHTGSIAYAIGEFAAATIKGQQ